MKKIFTTLGLIVAVLICRAQGFEGSLTWGLKFEITDPAAKEQVANAKMEARDPGFQKTYQDLQEKLKDPEFRAKLNDNPRMKADVQKVMGTMSLAHLDEAAAGKLVAIIKGNDFGLEMKGGMFKNGLTIIFISDSNRTYVLDHGTKAFRVLPKKEHAPETNQKITKTSETGKVLDYSCTKYILTKTNAKGETSEDYYWMTTELGDINVQAFSSQSIGGGPSLFIAGIDGVPLKVETFTSQGTITIEANEIKRRSLDASLFEVPSDYTEITTRLFAPEQSSASMMELLGYNNSAKELNGQAQSQSLATEIQKLNK